LSDYRLRPIITDTYTFFCLLLVTTKLKGGYYDISSTTCVSKGPLTPTESTLVGVAAGMMEVAVDQPLVTLKNELQKGGKITFSRQVLYGGFQANALWRL
jgi:hypothetical protein